ncbi:MAG: folylpolyglutamate synthase/dihydrofolate synthase family protein [Gemmatimonadales bacterium]
MGAVAKAAGPDRLDPLGADPLLWRLFPALATGVEWGLERTERALAALGDPHRAFRSLHVGGTNGKGSVTATLASVLERGHRVGTYTSPHLCSFLERILVDGRPLPEARRVAHADEAREHVARFELTFFVAATVLAVLAFAREGVEVAAVEVGLGGRLDATNVLSPEVSGVTNIAMDHADYLGDTLELIAREKAGIIEPGRPFVTGETDPALLAVFADAARRAGAPFHAVGPADVRDVRVGDAGTTFRMHTTSWGELSLATPLVGAHQAMNSAVAVAMLDRVGEDLRPGVDAVREGVAGVRHRGRNELRMIRGCTWLFDVAHNPAGILTLADTLDRLRLPRPLVGLVGILADKDWRAMLSPLLERVDTLVLAVPPSAPADRRWDPAAAVTALGVEGERAIVVQDFAGGVEVAERRARGGTVVVTGSVHTVGGAMKLLGVDPLA